MNPIDLYKKHIFHSKRGLGSREIKEICETILGADDLPLEVKASTYVVYLYKSLELMCGVEKSPVDRSLILSELKSNLLGMPEGELIEKGVREDPYQLYLSIMTSGWHYDLIFNKERERVVQDILDDLCFVFKYSSLKPSYSLNTFSTLLMLSYYLYSNGRYQDQRELSIKALSLFSKTARNIETDGRVLSSHIGDISKAALSLECIQAGVEWIDEVRFRKNLWDPDYVVRVMSRVRVKDFPKVKSALVEAIR